MRWVFPNVFVFTNSLPNPSTTADKGHYVDSLSHVQRFHKALSLEISNLYGKHGEIHYYTLNY
jgi:hypothetical protein